MKKKNCILFLILIATTIFGTHVFAADDTASGFYDIGIKDNVLIRPYVNDTEATVTEHNIDGDEEAEHLYIDSNRLEVSYNAASSGGYYGVILVEGNELPTKDNEIYYADQITAQSSSVDFNVYPVLPEKTTGLSLYITSDIQGFELVKVPLNYASNAEIILPYTIGDVNGDGKWNSNDSLIALQIIAQVYTDATDNERGAADVDRNGNVTLIDALKILQYGAGLIDSWKD